MMRKKNMATFTASPTVQDIRLFVETPKTLKPQLSWDELINNLIIPRPLPQIQTHKGLAECRPEKLLRAIGAAITDDRLAHGMTTAAEIFSSENKFKVVSCVNRVLIKLSNFGKEVVDSEEVHEICENSLIEEGETLAAKGYLLYRTQKQRRRETSRKLEVIRRNGKKAAWNPEKIQSALFKAFLAEYLEGGRTATDAEQKIAYDHAVQVTQKALYEITGSMQEVVHIEEIQDVIEETLDEMGFQETASRYSKWRFERARLREIKSAEEHGTIILPELVTKNLLARIDFASIDLNLSLSRQEL